MLPIESPTIMMIEKLTRRNTKSEFTLEKSKKERILKKFAKKYGKNG